VWAASTGDFIDSSPAVAGGAVYVGSYDHNLYAYNATSGAVLWAASTPDSVVLSPAVAGGLVYVASVNCNLYAFKAATGVQEWADPRFCVTSSPAVVNGKVYVGASDGLREYDP
jgi:outer membrane protein assembly factor BamB